MNHIQYLKSLNACSDAVEIDRLQDENTELRQQLAECCGDTMEVTNE